MINTRIIVDVHNDQKQSTDSLLIPIEEFDVKVHENVPYLTLQDISTQLEKRFNNKIMIDVWQELGTRGYIYRYGNYGRYWVEHGKTRGFA